VNPAVEERAKEILNLMKKRNQKMKFDLKRFK
jgi:hypothetical protein